MRDAVISEPLRTPVGRIGSALASLQAADLASCVIHALVERSELSGRVDAVVLGQCNPSGEAPAIGRVAALNAGLPVETSGLQVDRRCGSGLEAVLYASMPVQTGVADVVLAGGVESMSNSDFYSTGLRGSHGQGDLVLRDRLVRARETAGGRRYFLDGGMIETAEKLRAMYAIGREEQDELAFLSHQCAVAAQDAGRFDDEIVPVAVKMKGEESCVTFDKHPRRKTSLEDLSQLRPVMLASDPCATVTAGNASGQNDAASVCVVSDHVTAERAGLRPLARLRSWAVAGVDPRLMGLGPLPASQKALTRAGLEMDEIDLIELNEAFAIQVLAVCREWNVTANDFERLNVNGSGISLGHPLGATGARILTTLLREMKRRDVRYGLETLCVGGGQGIAAVFENI